MTPTFLPDIDDLKSVIADYLDTLQPGVSSVAERKRIIDQCISPFTQLMKICEFAGACDEAPRELLSAFMGDLLLQLNRHGSAVKMRASDNAHQDDAVVADEPLHFDRTINRWLH